MDERRAATLAQALACPLRMAILERLLAGPAAVSDLVSVTGAAQSNISNHLALLRERGLVAVHHQGRQALYRPSGPAVARVVEALLALPGAPRGQAAAAARGRRPVPPAPLALARTCYDHLAGLLGVRLLDGLVAAGAIGLAAPAAGATADGALPGAGLVVSLGPAAGEVLAGLGVGLGTAAPGRRRLAAACLDWTERRPHLGGALGALLCARFMEAGWVRRQDGTRAVTLTAGGRAALRDALGVDPGGALGEPLGAAAAR